MYETLPTWLQPSWQQLSDYQQAQKIPHALIINGDSGIGKKILIERFIRKLMCNNPLADHACGHCKNCHLLTASNHPDYFYVSSEQEGGMIKIDQIRELSVQLHQTAHISSYRIAVISPADKLNTAAANALLKTLEEPGKNTLLFLLTNHLEKLPITIRSRCQTLFCHAPTKTQLKEWLNNESVNEDILAITSHAPFLTRTYLQQGIATWLTQVKTLLLGLWQQQHAINQVAKQLLFNDNLALLVNLFMYWVTHAITAQLTAKQSEDTIITQLMQYDIKQLFNLYDELLRTKKILTTNVAINPVSQVENILYCLIIQDHAGHY